MQYAYLEDKAAKLGAEWRDVYAEMSRTSPGASVSREEFVWAAQCVQSRLFSGPYTGR